MSIARFGLSLLGVAALLAAALAGATIWLLFTEPVTVADAVSEQAVTPIVRELADLLYDAVLSLLRFL